MPDRALLCEVCRQAEAVPAADPYCDLDLCPLCRVWLNELRGAATLLALGIRPKARPEVVH